MSGASDRLWYFAGASGGGFRIARQSAIRGDDLPGVSHLDVTREPPPQGARYVLRGVVSNERYTTRAEKTALVAQQAGLGRPEAVVGAMIAIKKNASWWALTQDERRAIFEDRSEHVALGMRALPAVARRLHHCRDLGSDEPFDFLTWFDYRPTDTAAFDDLLGALRRSEEWQYIEREVELRVERNIG
jgi:hypothetical protein